MTKGSGTRSGLLWEVERILDECDKLPQILIMENVPQVVGTNSIKDFQDWVTKLESLGYSNFVEILNAKDYGIPQNRERCFMVSILGDYTYKMPKKRTLKYRLKDLLENEVDEKYYLSQQMIEGMMNTNFESYKLENKLQDPDGIANCIIARFEGTPQLVGGIGEKKSNGGTQYYQQDRIYDSNAIVMCHLANLPSGSYMYQINDLRIRKLTPRECWRLMGVKDEDFENVSKNQSNSSLYHLAGDSIVTTCLMGLMGELLGIDYQTKIDELTNELKQE